LAWLAIAASFVAAADQQVNPALNLYAKPQRLVHLQNGRRMNVLCEGSGVPTVILEAGAGGSTLDWRKVQSTLAQTTRVCSYDRAGMGYSDAGPLPRTADAVVTDLEALLKAAAIRGPYLIVAHSLGSFYARLYADRHLEDVVGMVLLDPSVEQQDRRFAELVPKFGTLMQEDKALQEKCLQLARAGRLSAEMPIFKDCTYGYARDPSFSDELFQVQIRRRLSVPFREALLSETAEMEGADSAQLLAGRRSYGNIPLVVLTQSPESPDAYPGFTIEEVDALNALWLRMHDELAALSSRGVNRVVERSGHYIQKDRPDVVIETVGSVFGSYRKAPRP
jgi:pimeloyl-ACP methyl ester carboxylesterase